LFEELSDVYSRVAASEEEKKSEIRLPETSFDTKPCNIELGNASSSPSSPRVVHQLETSGKKGEAQQDVDNSTLRLDNQKKADSKPRLSPSAIPVADMSVRSGYGSTRDIFSLSLNAARLSASRSSENLSSGESDISTSSVYVGSYKPVSLSNPRRDEPKLDYLSKSGPKYSESLKKKLSPSQNYPPNSINSRYGSNWQAMMENVSKDSQVLSRQYKDRKLGGKTSKLPSPIRLDHNTVLKSAMWPPVSTSG
jgi:hypothetical protein